MATNGSYRTPDRNRTRPAPRARLGDARLRMAIEALEARRLLTATVHDARADAFHISGIAGATAADYPPEVISIAPSTATYAPTKVTFSINGGPDHVRTGTAIREGVHTNDTAPAWAVSLLEDDGVTPIYPADATWKVVVTASWSDAGSSTGTFYYRSSDPIYVSPIVLPDLDWGEVEHPGVGAIRAGTYEQIASITIDRTVATTVTLPIQTLSDTGSAASTYSVVVNTAGNDTSTWKVVTASMSADKQSLVLAVDPGKDLGAAGMAAIRITDTANPTAAPRFVGVQVTDDSGHLPVKPGHLAIGAVNQNEANDVAFFRGTLAGDSIGMKQMDYQYIYLNGGPLHSGDGSTNWQAWRNYYAPWGYDGSKLIQSLRESWKGGSIPTVVYYNIQGNGVDDENNALTNLRDAGFLHNYFDDLKFTIDTIRRAANGATVSFIMEPDFLAYMMKYASAHPTPGTQAAPSSITLDYDVAKVARDVGFLPATSKIDTSTGATLVDFVHIVNEGVRSLTTNGATESVNLQFGWKFNLWADQAQYKPPVGGSWQRGIATVTDLYVANGKTYADGQAFIETIATETAQWYYQAGVTSSGMDFMAIDKYGTDGGNPYTSQTTPGFTDPANSGYSFNSDHWHNYLKYAHTISTQLAKLSGVPAMPIRMWQIPVGHVNTSQSANPFNGSHFAPISNSQTGPAVGTAATAAAYEDSAVTWVFGDTFTGQSVAFPVGGIGAVAMTGTTAVVDPTVAHTVTFTGGGGSGAAGTVVFDATGTTVYGIQVTSQGTGYTSAPTVTAAGIGGVTFTALVQKDATAHWGRNDARDPLVTSTSKVISWGKHLQELVDNGVEAVLFGPGLTTATEGGGYSNQLPQDDWFWAAKVADYLRNPTPIKAAPHPVAPLSATAGMVARTTGTTPTATLEVTRADAAPLMAALAAPGDTAAPLAAAPLPAVDLPIRVIGGSARHGDDYSKTLLEKIVVHFDAGQTRTLVPLQLLPTRGAQPIETLRLRIGDGAPGGVSTTVTLNLGTTVVARTATAFELASAAGQAMFTAASAKRSALRLLSQPTVTTGVGGAGLAAAALVLNASGAARPAGGNPFDPVFLASHPGVLAALGRQPRLSGGLTLDGLGKVLESFGVRTDTVHAQAGGLALFRRQAVSTLGSKTGHVVANFDRGSVGLGTGSHFATVAAYDGRTDRFLLVDADRSHQGPVWVAARDLFDGMRAIDPRTCISGGYTLVNR